MSAHAPLRERILHILPLFAVGIVASFAFAAMAVANDMTSEKIIDLINEERAAQNLAPLSLNEKLSRAAALKAEDMIKHDYFAHTSPHGQDPWHWLKQEDYQYKAAGENLAINFSDAQKEHDAWMASQTHRENILNPQYEEIGIAVVRGEVSGEETLVTVSLFGKPAVTVSRGVGAPVPAPKKVALVKGAEIQAPPVSSSWLNALTLAGASLLALSLLAGPLVFLWKAFRAFRPVLEHITKHPAPSAT